MNKYLVILAGSPRGGERTYSSLYKRVCEYLSADLAICTSIDKVDEEISLFKKADYKWILDIQDDFFKYYEKMIKPKKKFYAIWKKRPGVDEKKFGDNLSFFKKLKNKIFFRF